MKRKTYLDRYRVIADDRGALAVLRRHGTAVSYKAEDTRDGSEVEVEVILAFGLEAKVREELQREGKAARELNHPNIPALLEFQAETDQFVYVWEHVAGTPVEAWVREHGPMPVGPVLRIASQIVSALGAAAYRSLVHRAINPENVVLVPGQTPQGDWPMVKILQWIGTVPAGSKYAGKNMASDTTFSFVSPEQTRDGTVNFESEIYSLGATLWFLLTGAAPNTEIALPHLSGVPKPALHLLGQMLARDPAQRPHDPLAFEHSLRECLEQVDRRETMGRKLGVPVAIAVPAKVTPIAPATTTASWRPWALAALFLLLATLGAIMLPLTLQPGTWFTQSKQSQSIGVPVGVPEAVAQAASSYPEPGKLESDSDDPSPAKAPAVIAASNAIPPTTAPAPAAAEVPPPQVTAMTAPVEAPVSATPPAPAPATVLNTQPTFPGKDAQETIAKIAQAEGASAPSPVTAVTEPEMPAEAPAETSEPPAYAVEDTEPSEPIRAATEVEPAQAASTAMVENEPAATQSSDEQIESLNGLPVRRAVPVTEQDLPNQRTAQSTRGTRKIDGREVRLAEPVYDGSPAPGLPRRAIRARFIGTTPEGEMVFEAPSAERGYVRPRR